MAQRWGEHPCRWDPSKGAGSSTHAGAVTLPRSQHIQVPRVTLWSEDCASASSPRCQLCPPRGKPLGIFGFPLNMLLCLGPRLFYTRTRRSVAVGVPFFQARSENVLHFILNKADLWLCPALLHLNPVPVAHSKPCRILPSLAISQ